MDRDAISKILEGAASKRAVISPDDLMVIGGQKLDMSQEISDKKIPKYVTANGKIFDTDSGLQVEMADTIEIDNRVLKVGDFGGDAATIIVDLYEMFLQAHQMDIETVFNAVDCSEGIPDMVKDDPTVQRIKSRMRPDGTWEKYLPWGDPRVEFEQWLHVSAATARWRIRWDLQRRLLCEMDIRRREDYHKAKDVLETVLIAIEKYIALPEKGRLLGV